MYIHVSAKLVNQDVFHIVDVLLFQVMDAPPLANDSSEQPKVYKCCLNRGIYKLRSLWMPTMWKVTSLRGSTHLVWNTCCL